MATPIFSIANQKGGVGKTTTAVNLAFGLARQGVKTLLIDLDPQANATSAAGLEKEPGKSIYSVLHADDDILSKILPTSQNNLSIIPSEIDLAAIEVELGQKENYLAVLREHLAPLRRSKRFDAIIVDCPPALGMLSMNCLAAADHLIVALQCEYLAMEGLGQILNVVQQLKDAKINPKLSVGGVIMTMYDQRTRLSRQVVEELIAHFPDLIFKTKIPRSVRVSEAPSFGQSIFEYAPLSSGAVAYKKLVREFMKRFSLTS